MGVFPHTEHLLEEERQKENWREAERLIKALQASVGGGGPPTGAAGGDLSGTYPNPSIANGVVTSGKIADGTIVNDDINASAAIDATKIGAGGVTSTEFGYIGTLTSDAQTQINAKAGTGSANTFTLGQLFPDGSASSNALARSADVTTGINFAANTVAISAAGTNRFSVSSTIVTTTIPIRTSNGTAAAPTHSFTAQPVTGMYAVGSNRVGLSTNSTLRFDINTARVLFALPPVFGSGAVAFGATTIVGGGTTTNVATTDSSSIVVDTTGAGETIQFYAVSSAQDGATYFIVDAYNNAAANNVVIKDNGGTTIGTITTNGGWALVRLDFTNGVINCKVLA